MASPRTPLLAALATGLSGSVRLFVGVAIVAGSLGGVWWVVNSTSQLEPFVVTVNEVVQGHPVEDIDTEVVYLANPGNAVALIRPPQWEQLEGLVARGPIPAGSLLQTTWFDQPMPSDDSVFRVEVDIGGANWLTPGAVVDIWVSAPIENQRFSLPMVEAAGARVLATTYQEGFAANPEVVLVDIGLNQRDLPALIHARANDFDIQLTPSTADQSTTRPAS